MYEHACTYDKHPAWTHKKLTSHATTHARRGSEGRASHEPSWPKSGNEERGTKNPMAFPADVGFFYDVFSRGGNSPGRRSDRQRGKDLAHPATATFSVGRSTCTRLWSQSTQLRRNHSCAMRVSPDTIPCQVKKTKRNCISYVYVCPFFSREL